MTHDPDPSVLLPPISCWWKNSTRNQGRLVMESKEVGLLESRAGRSWVEDGSGEKVW